MAQCNGFIEAGFRAFYSDRVMLSGSRISGRLACAHLSADVSPSSSIHEMARKGKRLNWNSHLTAREFKVGKKVHLFVRLVFATHIRSHVNVSVAEDGRASSLVLEETDIVCERARLKTELCNVLERTTGSLDEDGKALVSSLQKVNPYPDITLCGKELYTGFFEGVKASFKGTGRKGEANKEVGASGTILTLGRASFNSFKPQGLEIRLQETYNHVGQASNDDYSIFLTFSVNDNNSSLPPVEGLLSNKANFSVSNPGRMEVVFMSCTLAPRYPKRDLDRWLRLFRADNPDMNDDGSLTVSLPPAKGWLDYLYLDEEIRITKGNRGGVFVVRRLDKPVI